MTLKTKNEIQLDSCYYSLPELNRLMACTTLSDPSLRMHDDLLFLIAHYVEPSTIKAIQSLVQNYELEALFQERLSDQYFWLFHEDSLYMEHSPHRRLYEFIQDHPNFDYDRMAVEDMEDGEELLDHFQDTKEIIAFHRDTGEWCSLLYDLIEQKGILDKCDDFADWITERYSFYWSDSESAEFLCALEALTMDDALDMINSCAEDIVECYIMEPRDYRPGSSDYTHRTIGRDFDTAYRIIRSMEDDYPHLFK